MGVVAVVVTIGAKTRANPGLALVQVAMLGPLVRAADSGER